MTEELQFICVVTLLFILACMTYFLKPDDEEVNKTQKQHDNKTKNINSVDALNSLLSQGVITQQEYNKLIVKLLNK
jgi:uncharacterized membrane protein